MYNTHFTVWIMHIAHLHIQFLITNADINVYKIWTNAERAMCLYPDPYFANVHFMFFMGIGFVFTTKRLAHCFNFFHSIHFARRTS